MWNYFKLQVLPNYTERIKEERAKEHSCRLLKPASIVKIYRDSIPGD